MKRHSYLRIVFTVWALVVIFELGGYKIPAICGGPGIKSSNIPFTPAPGSPLRKAILDALRQEVKRLHGLEVVFVVHYLMVKQGWAWVQTRPQSPGGSARYEGVSALLQISETRWEVAELACAQEEDPACLGHPEYFKQLKKRFPQVPEDIFPGPTEIGQE